MSLRGIRMGGIFSSPKTPVAPTPPDPAKTIEAQTRATQLSQFTPSGNLLFGSLAPGGGFAQDIPGQPFDVDLPRALQVQETPFQEELRGGVENLALGFLPQVSGQLDPFSISAQGIQEGLTPLVTDLQAQGEQLEQATFERGRALLEPRFEEQRERLEQRLVDQGLPRGGEAFTRELNRLQEGQGEQLTRLSLDAVAAGRQEQSRIQALGSQLRAQQFQEGTGLSALERQIRAQQFGEVGSIGGFATPFTQISAPGVNAAGIINQGFQNQLGVFNTQQQAAAAQQAGLGSTLSGIGSIAAAAAPQGFAAFSDERLKENIEPLGKENDHNVYEFNYKGNDTKYIGVMAQEVEEIMPEAVIEVDGYKAVNYDMIGVEFRYG